MGRGIFAGMTDYSHQSFDNMLGDLKQWNNDLKKLNEFFDNTIQQLEENGYWQTLPFNVKSVVEYLRIFYQTSIDEISDIVDCIQKEVESNYITRLISLAQTAKELIRSTGKVWNDSWDRDYHDKRFLVFERMYARGQDMVGGMLDLENLALRLKDFIGKKSNILDNYSKIQFKPVLSSESFVDLERINQLRSINSPEFNLVKLIKLCEELNKCYANECFFAVTFLTRSIMDHIPPIFKCKNFLELANQYSGNGRSFRDLMQNLENSSRKIADSHLHTQIRKKEILPNKTQVNFSSDLDVLLAEIVRILK